MITSTNNETIKLVRSLQHRKFRDATGLLYVEGLRPFVESLDLANDLEMVLVSSISPERRHEANRPSLPRVMAFASSKWQNRFSGHYQVETSPKVSRRSFDSIGVPSMPSSHPVTTHVG